jgi:hypothetical protein
LNDLVDGTCTRVNGTHIVFWDGFNDFCDDRNIIVGSVIVVKIDPRDNCIGLEVENLGD